MPSKSAVLHEVLGEAHLLCDLAELMKISAKDIADDIKEERASYNRISSAVARSIEKVVAQVESLHGLLDGLVDDLSREAIKEDDA